MNFSDHAAHKWIESRPCVYCEPCGVRLYQGRIPATPADKESLCRDMDALMVKASADRNAKDAKEWAERTPEQERIYGEGFAAFREGVGYLDRMGLNPYTPKKTGHDYRSPEARVMRWWNWGWNDAEFGNEDRRRPS